MGGTSTKQYPAAPFSALVPSGKKICAKNSPWM